MNIEIVSGSPREGSVTVREAKFLVNYLQTNTQHNIGLIDVREWPVPAMLQTVYSNVNQAPDELKPLVKRVLEADAFILVTPEYNGSYTPALKNLFDHFPKQLHKTFGIVTASPGALGGMRASQQMQLLINALFGIAVPQMLITPGVDKKFSEEGGLIDESFLPTVKNFITEFLWVAERLANK